MEAPAIWKMSGGRLILEGMLLQQAPSNDEAEHVALLHFPSARILGPEAGAFGAGAGGQLATGWFLFVSKLSLG